MLFNHFDASFVNEFMYTSNKIIQFKGYIFNLKRIYVYLNASFNSIELYLVLD